MKVLGTLLILLTLAQPVMAETSVDFLNQHRTSLNSAQVIFDGIRTSQTFTAVPITDHVETAKDSILKKIVIQIARGAIQQMVNSTIKWANTGFEGRPVYLTNPKEYFRTLGDGLVGDFINDELGFLCSPFQAQIKIAIAKQFVPEYHPQCTLTEIGVNLKNFYQNFDQGGWDAWFSLTQQESNNPYGAYLGASIEASSRLAREIGFANQQLQFNDGFFDIKDCIKRNPTSPTAPGYKSNYKPGACIEWGPPKTPGSMIANQINQQLHVGQDQLISATDIDQLLNAVMIGVLQRTVFSQDGIFKTNPYQETPITVEPPSNNGTATCSADVSGLRVGQTGVWSANIASLPNGTTYKWIGSENDEIPTGGIDNEPKLSIIYQKVGIKNASLQLTFSGGSKATVPCSTSIVVTDTSCKASVSDTILGKTVTWTADPGSFPVTSYEWTGTDLPSNVSGKTTIKSFDTTYQTTGTKTAKVTFYGSSGNPVTSECGSVTVRDFDPLAVSCSTADSVGAPGANTTWNGRITGGSGKFTTIQFAGEEENAPGVSGQSGKIWPTPSSQTLTNIYNSLTKNGPPSIGPIDWNYLTSDFVIRKSTTSYSIGAADGILLIEVKRAYYTPRSAPYTATLRVVDADPKVEPVTATCTGGYTVAP